MKYVVDNDLHIHTHQSICSRNPMQNPENILRIAKERGLKRICITDHYWDAAVPCNTKYNWWYEEQDFSHISEILPLPKDDEVTFLFGCETDLDSSYNIGITPERLNDFDFIIISTTHFHHMTGDEWENPTDNELAELWVKRLETVLDMDLPFRKIGLAHLACKLINNRSRESYLNALNLIKTDDLKRLFNKAADKGVGIELNYNDISCDESETDTVFRMFHIAKECGCKFYLGSDAHVPSQFNEANDAFIKAIEILGLEEKDKFIVG